MTEAMTAIYGALGDLMASCVKELRGSNKIDAGELRLEDGLFRAFDDIVRRQLDAVWHTVSPRTKQASHGRAGFHTMRALAKARPASLTGFSRNKKSTNSHEEPNSTKKFSDEPAFDMDNVHVAK